MKGWMLCHVIDPWEGENTNCVKRKHNWAIELQANPYINPWTFKKRRGESIEGQRG
jgi:hypothetical protein